MTDDRYRFRLIEEHKDSATGEPSWDTFHEWYRTDQKLVRRDALGRSHKSGGSYRWGFLVCANTDCPGRAMWRSDLVEQAADEWDERR